MDGLQVIAEPRRREILRLVWDEEVSAGEIAARFDVSFPAVSQHLAVLREAGFVCVRHVGTRRLYRADRDRLGDLADVLERMWASTLDDLAALAENAEATDG
jgi:DNA-binding transcriptional ArsR family regulator